VLCFIQAELLVICNNVLVVIDGPSLTATILSCKDKNLSREEGAYCKSHHALATIKHISEQGDNGHRSSQALNYPYPYSSFV